MYDVEAITKYVVWDSSSATKESLYNVFVQPVASHLRSKKRNAKGGGKAGAEDKVRPGHRDAVLRRARMWRALLPTLPSRHLGTLGGALPYICAHSIADGHAFAQRSSAPRPLALCSCCNKPLPRLRVLFDLLPCRCPAQIAFDSYEELVASFTEVLTSRRVTEQMRQLMSALVCEIITAWRQEFCRMISLKLNSFFLMPFCESLSAYMRHAMLKLGEDGGLGFAPPEGHPGARVDALRLELSKLTGEKAALQRLGSRMQANALAGRSAVLRGWTTPTKW
jgi:hypothetical protein